MLSMALSKTKTTEKEIKKDFRSNLSTSKVFFVIHLDIIYFVADENNCLAVYKVWCY